jgi:hypothetical protein
MQKIIIAACLTFTCGAGTNLLGQEAAGTRKVNDIRHLLTITGAGELGTQIIEQSLAQLRDLFTLLPPEIRDRVMKEFETELRKEFAADKMIELVIPIYDKYLTAEEIKELIAFYESPIGQKVITALPQIARDAWEAGAQRGKDVGDRVFAKLRAEGVLGQPSPPPPKPQPARKSPRRSGRP